MENFEFGIPKTEKKEDTKIGERAMNWIKLILWTSFLLAIPIQIWYVFLLMIFGLGFSYSLMIAGLLTGASFIIVDILIIKELYGLNQDNIRNRYYKLIILFLISGILFLQIPIIIGLITLIIVKIVYLKIDFKLF